MAGSAEKRLKKLAKKSDKKLEKMTKFINKKSEKAIKKHLKNKKKEAKKAALEAAPGTSKLEKRLNIAGAKARARKADRQESKKLRKEGPLQQTSRKIEMPKTEVKVNSPGPKKIQTKEKSFSETFKENRKMLGPGKTFTWKGEKYTTNLKEEENKAKHGASLAIMIAPVKSKTKKVKAIKKGAKAQNGGKLTGPKKKNGKDKMKDLNLSDLVHRPSKNKDENWIMLASNPPKYRNTKTNEVISEDEYYKRTGKKKPEGGIKPLRK
jgi:hypothetical protein